MNSQTPLDFSAPKTPVRKTSIKDQNQNLWLTSEGDPMRDQKFYEFKKE